MQEKKKVDNELEIWKSWQADWNKFAFDVLGAKLDNDQKAILSAVQKNKMVSVVSGTARGKDYISAVACLCFLYLTPRWENGALTENTKVAMTAPTDRQVGNIMFPEISRLFNKAKVLPGRLTGYDIRTTEREWFLTGFKADEYNHEAWSGFHAANTMFVVTEASGISESTFAAIEGNLQGNSRMLIVFNPNIISGYAANSQKSDRWVKFRLDCLNAPNVIEKKIIIPGQVDYEWVKDKVENWCTPIQETDFIEDEGDFKWEGNYYRPDDYFRIKVRGMFPKEGHDSLVPLSWIEAAEQRYLRDRQNTILSNNLNLGVDVAGMGRDSSVLCPRYDNIIEPMIKHQSNGKADHMHVVGMVVNKIGKKPRNRAFVDTIGEGAGVFSRLQELDFQNVYSCKFSESADGLTDITGQFKFVNMRAYLYWAIRDLFNPRNKYNVMLAPGSNLKVELTATHWSFNSKGEIVIEPKEKIKERIGHSPDDSDSLANTFYPQEIESEITNYEGIFL